jgi:hypothetical protein
LRSIHLNCRTSKRPLNGNAKDRGCRRPGCTAPGYLSKVHHISKWAKTHRTDIDDLTFVCGPDHRLLDEEGWTVRKRRGHHRPPPQLDFGKPRTNGYWHLDRYFRMDTEDDDP